MKKFLLVFACVAVGVVGVDVQTAEASTEREPEVRIFEYRKKKRTQPRQGSFIVGDRANRNGGTVAVADVTGNGKDNIIVGSGPGDKPIVRVYTKKGKLLHEFLAYGEGMKNGISVAAGDLDGDGKAEIVTGPGKGAGPQVRVFNKKGKIKFTPGFDAFDSNFRGGVQVAVGHLRGSGKKGQIIVGAGPGGGAHVRVFTRKGKFTGLDYFPFSSEDRGGVSVAAANVDGGATDEVVVAMHSYGVPTVKVYKSGGDKRVLGEWKAYDDAYRGGVNVAAADIDGDGVEEVITATRQDGNPTVKFFKGHGKLVDSGRHVYESDFHGGVSIAAGNVDKDGKAEIVVIPQKKIIDGRTDLYKYIEVDLSEQTLRAYRGGVKEHEFLVSTGTRGHETPVGEFSVRRKIPIKDFISLDQDTLSANYYETLEDVHFNMEFLPHYYIHEAYWHNNFGNPMSHGCVNVSLHNVEKIYSWANLGDPVIIKQ